VTAAKRVLTLIAMCIIAGPIVAQEGLYAPVLPDDTAYVRLINATAAPRSIDLGTLRIGPVAPDSGSLYHPVRPGVFVVFAGRERVPVTASPKSFQTVVLLPETAFVASDSHHDDPLRSQLIVYNADTSPVRIDAVSPVAPLFERIDPGESAAIVINAIPVTVRATLGGGQTIDSELVLTRGDSYAIVVGADRAFVVKAGVQTAR